ncbi:hypothetical protein ABZ626_25120 [Streptomyces longispororuber]|uniref:hypothetical protein n=1 Tax=Streptomyces longispororuber TaxID=68230 RepID=UPI00340C9C84
MTLPPDPATNFDTSAVGTRVEARVLARVDGADDVREAAAPARNAVRRRIVIGTAAAAVAAAATAVVLGDVPRRDRADAYRYVASVTPPVLRLTPTPQSAGRTLLDLAAKVEKQPAPHPSEWIYTKTWGWSLNIDADAPLGAATAAVPTVSEQWINKDGSGRDRSAFGEPLFPHPETEAAARERGLVAGTGVTDERYGPGHYDAPRPVPDDPRALAKLIRTKSSAVEENGRRELLVALAAWAGEGKMGGDSAQHLSGTRRATMLRVLAEPDRYFDFGPSDADRDGEGYGPLRTYTTRTWQGQEALAVVTQQKPGHDPAHPKHYSRETLLISPDTGAVMGSEEAIFGDPLKINVKQVPATLSVRETLTRQPVRAEGARP